MTKLQSQEIRRAVVRRGRTSAEPLRKAGWQVRRTVLEAVKHAVEHGAAESQNAFVERAIIRELRDIRRQRVFDAYAQAAADPVFMAEMEALTNAFDNTTADGLSAAAT
jgi:hypothetical protein